MLSRCSGYTPQFRKMETPIPYPFYPDNTLPDTITPTTPMNPVMPVPTTPAAPTGGTNPNPSPSTTPGLTPPTTTRPSGPTAPGNPLMPEVIPNAPLFTVPTNPLLPPEYQEVLSYDSLQYLNGFLRTQIGRYCDVQFLVGSNTTETRSGMLIGVGINYILLQDPESKEVIACDFYSIKFIDFHM